MKYPQFVNHKAPFLISYRYTLKCLGKILALQPITLCGILLVYVNASIVLFHNHGIVTAWVEICFNTKGARQATVHCQLPSKDTFSNLSLITQRSHTLPQCSAARIMFSILGAPWSNSCDEQPIGCMVSSLVIPTLGSILGI